MRVFLALATTAVALSLSGCDMRGSDQKQANCNCATTPAAPPTATTTPPPDTRGSTAYVPSDDDIDGGGHHYRHHYYGHGGHHHPHGYATGGGHHGYYYWRREYSEISVATYDYHSGSTSTYFGGDSYHGGHGEHDGGGYHDADHGWIDGYGRGHGGSAGSAVHYESGTDDGRGHIWHGYDADCPDDPHHGHH